jgi:uncharacterized coiled-coil DUF342 family protein
LNSDKQRLEKLKDSL